ncbi:hypothetical protein Tco_1467465 [Tanacetum coccineum]
MDLSLNFFLQLGNHGSNLTEEELETHTTSAWKEAKLYLLVCRYFRHSASSLPILQLPICFLPLGTWVSKIGESNRQPLAILRPNSSLSAALNLFVQGIESCDKDIQGSQDNSGRIYEERNGESMLWPEVA